jgi:transposase InsO family protein
MSGRESLGADDGERRNFHRSARAPPATRSHAGHQPNRDTPGQSLTSRLCRVPGQDTDLVVNALSMAVTRRQPEKGKTVLHSDHGTQYTAWAFGKRIGDAGILGSMGIAGDCYDNAMMQCR